jgi:hypothetical protein
VERGGHFFFCFLTPARFFESSAHQVVGCSACLSEFLIEPQLNLNVTILEGNINISEQSFLQDQHLKNQKMLLNDRAHLFLVS